MCRRCASSTPRVRRRRRLRGLRSERGPSSARVQRRRSGSRRRLQLSRASRLGPRRQRPSRRGLHRQRPRDRWPHQRRASKQLRHRKRTPRRVQRHVQNRRAVRCLESQRIDLRLDELNARERSLAAPVRLGVPCGSPSRARARAAEHRRLRIAPTQRPWL